MNNQMQDLPAKHSSAKPWAWVPSLYFAEGLPYVAVMTISIILYKQLGLSNAKITFYTSWLYLPWVIKPLWSPFIDLVKTKRWWVVAMELLIGAAFGGVAFTIPTTFWLQGSLFFFWVMAFASATHDIAADGFYMLGLNEHDQTWFVGIRSTFYRLATIFGQGILVMIAGNLQVIFRNNIPFSWSLLFYGVMGLFLVLWLWHSYILPHPREDVKNRGEVSGMWKGLKETGATFVTKIPLKEVVFSLLFIFLYCVPEGLLTKVSALFLIDAPHNGGLGLSPQEYGLVQGTVGVIGLTLGGILGGFCAGKDGLKKWLWPMVCAITLPNFVYVYLSYALPSSLIIVNVCVFFEQFGYGFGFTAYMLYLIYYSQGAFKTSHYALCTALMALSMMIPGLFAGALQELVGYRHFFIIVMCVCSLTFIVSSFLKIDPEFGKKKEEDGLEEEEKMGDE
ncbi:MAG: MFS transporter [Prevotella sp.]|jgi:PAT family beta-lactamase induction signal transducer AmpG|nr:MFS transporter [Prevotella sp.]MCH4100775.1 MFS transporter [Prevotella sp.]MCI1323972.1 MFS transporter [Prevotella sp.]MCI1350418.1 MFS transporter [Prevotella sp.]MCI1416546.1 MFS transporter [Prevotella sp.]